LQPKQMKDLAFSVQNKMKDLAFSVQKYFQSPHQIPKDMTDLE